MVCPRFDAIRHIRGFILDENKTAELKGGKISGNKVVSPENYLTEPENQKRLKK